MVRGFHRNRIKKKREEEVKQKPIKNFGRRRNYSVPLASNKEQLVEFYQYKGKITKYSVVYRIKISPQGDWHEVVRYDNYEKYAHKHIFRRRGKKRTVRWYRRF